MFIALGQPTAKMQQQACCKKYFFQCQLAHFLFSATSLLFLRSSDHFSKLKTSLNLPFPIDLTDHLSSVVRVVIYLFGYVNLTSSPPCFFSEVSRLRRNDRCA
ncbi:hypothetical protein CAEBREN_30305 [Caenorhabditis brenneri]|uniref:Uncharacterized protein n=1 Tax=Caenorhabditis brenneri TaxID=135651 RepID=G0ML31_CAEBE|nr:hypothetical protein CAEBREN_30305 [Caenorhabditis brenneri]